MSDTIWADEARAIDFGVFDDDGALKSGLVDGDFTKTVFKDGIATSIAPTMTEIGSTGVYTLSYVHMGPGRYHALVFATATPNVSGVWEDDVDVVVGPQVFCGRSLVKNGDNAEFEIVVKDRKGNLIDGLSFADFGDRFLALNGANVTPSFSISAVGSGGRYKVVFATASNGVYEAVIGDQLRGHWTALFDVTTHGIIDTIPPNPPTAAAIRIEMDSNSSKLAHLDADISSRLAAGVPVEVGSIDDGVINESTFGDDAISDRVLAPDVDTYQAKIGLEIDASDRFVVKWFKNTQPIDSGVTAAKIKVVFAEDGTDLFGLQDMVDVGNGRFKFDQATHRITPGEAYLARVEATIDGQTRTAEQTIGRDSSS